MSHNQQANFANVGRQLLNDPSSNYLNANLDSKNASATYLRNGYDNGILDMNNDLRRSYPNDVQQLKSLEETYRQRKLLNQLQYVNSVNVNQIYQQQQYLNQQNEFMKQMLYEQNALKEHLQNIQKTQLLNQKMHEERMKSREKERSALEILDEFQKATSGKANSLPNAWTGNSNQMDYPMSFNDQMRHDYTPFSNIPGYIPINYNENMGFNSVNTLHPYPQSAWQLDKKEKQRKHKQKIGEMLMSGLQKQNDILINLAGNGNYDDHMDFQEFNQLQKLKKNQIESLMSNPTKIKESSPKYQSIFNNQDQQQQQQNLPFNAGLLMQMMPFGQMPPLPYKILMDPKTNPELRKLLKKERAKERARIKREDKLEKLLMLLAAKEKEKDNEKNDDDTPEKPPKSEKPKPKNPKPEKKPQNLPLPINSPQKPPEKTEAQKKEEQLKAMRKKKMFRRAVLWLMVYPIIWQQEFEKRQKKKKETATERIIEELGPSLELGKNWAVKAADKALAKYDLKMNLSLMPPPNKKIPEKDLTSRTQQIYEICKAVLEGMTNTTTEELMQRKFLDFLVNMMFDHCFLPQSFLFEFEISRLNFNSYGQLKSTTPMKVKMMLCFFLFIRCVIHRVLLRPWESKPTLKLPAKDTEKEQFKTSLRTIASILFILGFEYLKGLTPLQPDNQKHLAIENKIKSTPAPLKIFDDYQLTEEEQKRKKDEVDMIMLGLYRRPQLEDFLNKKQYVDQLKALISGWVDKAYEILEKINSQKVKPGKNKNMNNATIANKK